jgi:hypothetical protein
MIFASVPAASARRARLDQNASCRRHSKLRKSREVSCEVTRGATAGLDGAERRALPPRASSQPRPRRHCQSTRSEADAFSGRAARPRQLSPARWGHPGWAHLGSCSTMCGRSIAGLRPDQHGCQSSRSSSSSVFASRTSAIRRPSVNAPYIGSSICFASVLRSCPTQSRARLSAFLNSQKSAPCCFASFNASAKDCSAAEAD